MSKIVNAIKFTKNWFFSKRILKHVILLLATQICLAVLFSPLFAQTEIASPDVTDTGERVPMHLLLLILIIVVLGEDTLIRGVPYFGMKKLFKDKFYTDKRIYIPFLIAVTLIHPSAHLTNIISGTLLGTIAYFLIHVSSGFYFGWLVFRKGFWACYAVHILYDLVIFGMIYITTVSI